MTPPGRLLARHLRDLTTEEYFFGWMFLAAGTVLGEVHAA
jgi:hypothetical protein